LHVVTASSTPRLEQLGWSSHFEEQFDQLVAQSHKLEPARVAVEHRGAYLLYTEGGERLGEVSARLRSDASGRGDFPAVGDWVAVSEGGTLERLLIHAVVPRRTKFSRKVAWKETEEQVVAANVDVVFLVAAFGHDFNPRRLERYLTMAWESGADPAILLTKSDLADELPQRLLEIESIAFGVPVHPLCALTGEGLDALEGYLTGNRTVALLGSSGVGKSTLINRLLGDERLATREIRADGRGRHTTSHRELVLLPSGALVIDTPGMRELQLWEAGSGIESAFADVESLARECRFGDCSHDGEPGCAVREAIASGRLDPERLESYEKLLRELRHLELKLDKRALSEERKRRRAFARSIRNKPQKGR
jgi:ribosome biogenesis GTPase